MTAEIGLFALILAFTISLGQSVVPMWGAAKGNMRLMKFGAAAAVAQLIFVFFAMACLIYAFVQSDFSLEVVAANSHTSKPLIYKISAAWGHHEGSMLLWIVVLALFGSAVAVFGNNLPATLKARVLGIQGMIGAAFLAFLIFTSNPFARLEFPPVQGMGFNPLLQDPGLAVHPPMLYLGYVGFSIAYSFSIAALIEGKVDAAWARWVRPWVLAAWCFLTFGITLGSLWAYYELGWGGWWFWDPVENASFMPWLVGTALLHSALVVERRHTLVNWTLLLSILTFTLSLIGTFLVRSGVLTSVHSFAVDPARGVFILVMILAASGGGLLLFAMRAHTISRGPPFAFVSREGALLVNNLLLICAAGTVFLGTFFPLLADAALGEKYSVGPPYFHATFTPIMMLLVAAMVFGPMLRWRSDKAGPVFKSLRWPVIGALFITIIVFFFQPSVSPVLETGASASFMRILHRLAAAMGIGLAMWLIFGLADWLVQRLKIGKVPFKRSVTMMRAFPGATWGFLIAHLGLAVTLIGITSMSAWETEATAFMKVGDTAGLGAYEYTLIERHLAKGKNYEAEQLNFTVAKNGKPNGTIMTERRYYPERDMVTTEAGVRSGLTANLYIAASGADGRPGYSVRLNYHPFAMWIWFGGFMIGAGGFVSLADRRFRVGAPHRSNASLKPVPAE